jgi:hypothetical protein
MSKKYPGLRKASEPFENIDWSQLKSGVWAGALKGDFSKQTEILEQLKQLQEKQVEIREEIDKIAKQYRKGMGGRFPKAEIKLKESFKKGLGKTVYKDFIKKIKTYNDIQKQINKIKPGGNMINFMHAIDPNVGAPPVKKERFVGDPRTYKKRTKVSEALPPPVMGGEALPEGHQPLSLGMEQVALPAGHQPLLLGTEQAEPEPEPEPQPKEKKKAQGKKKKSKKKKSKKGKKTKRYSRKMRGSG